MSQPSAKGMKEFMANEQSISRKIKDAVRTLYIQVPRLLSRPLLWWEWKTNQRVFLTEPNNERTIEYAFALNSLRTVWPKEVLDVGTGTTAFPHILSSCCYCVTAADEIKTYWKRGMFNRHYHVVHEDITQPKMNRQFDFITCISVLEHIPDHQAALKGMFQLLKPGAHLALSFPYNEKRYIPDVYRLDGVASKYSNRPIICQMFSRKEIDEWLSDNSGEVVDQEYFELFTGEYWGFGERLQRPTKVTADENHHLSCVLIKKLSR